MKYKCSRTVRDLIEISNCGTNALSLVISSDDIGILFIDISPVTFPLVLWEIAAKSVVFPAPLAPNTAVRLPDSKRPLTLYINLFALHC